MFCWHKWNKWSDPHNGVGTDADGSVGWLAVMQLRTCAKCGVAQVRRLPKMRSIDSLRSER